MLKDILIAAGAATAVTIATLVGAEPTTGSSAVAAYLLGIVLGTLLLVRRRWPRAVLALSVAAVLGYNLTDLPAVSPVWALLVPLYTVARHGHLVTGVMVGAAVETISIAWALTGDAPGLPLLDGIWREAAVVAVVLVAAEAIRSRHLLARETGARQERDWARRLLVERLTIARELHDVTAHTVAVVGIQMNLAGELLDHDPAAARELLRNARQINTETIGELQTTVRLLREDRDRSLDKDPMPDETRIPTLLDRAAEAGLTTEFDQRGEPEHLPPVIGLTLYRIAQESVTNVLRHANAQHVKITLCRAQDRLELVVTDDGVGPAGEPNGLGLAGMRERATSLGGTLTVGVAPGGGFLVRAEIPR